MMPSVCVETELVRGRLTWQVIALLTASAGYPGGTLPTTLMAIG